MKFPVLCMSVWAGQEGDMPRMGPSVPFAYHLELLCKSCRKKIYIYTVYSYRSETRILDRILYHWVLRDSGSLVIKKNFLFQIEKLLLRNQSPHKAVTDQAYRLQQGLFLASTQQQVFLHGWTDTPFLGALTIRQNWSIKWVVSLNWKLHLAPCCSNGWLALSTE